MIKSFEFRRTCLRDATLDCTAARRIAEVNSADDILLVPLGVLAKAICTPSLSNECSDCSGEDGACLFGCLVVPIRVRYRL